MNACFALFLDRCKFTIELLIACALFFAPLRRRPHFRLRVLLGALACVGAMGLYSFTTWQFLLSFLLVGGFALLCCDISPSDALYCVACAYATQHVSALVHEGVYYLLGLESPTALDVGVWFFAIRAMVYALFYFLFARHLAGEQHFHLDTKRSLLSTLVILLIVLVLSLAANGARTQGAERLFFICRLYAMFSCVFFLWVQVSLVRQARLQEELLFQRQLARQQREQYELTRETIDLINRKSHDLKHQVAALRTLVPEGQREKYLSEIERSVQIYDSTIQTGNEVLDTVLTEKSLYCEAHQIAMTCMADGERLSFLDPVDLYTIFGNALDNAIEGVSRLEDPERRVVSVSVRAKSGLMIFQFENCCEGTLRFRDGLPETTKDRKEDHGFGLRSIRYTVEKYGGHMVIRQEEGLFLLRLSIPLPEDEAPQATA